MSILYNNILRLCEKRGISPSKMCVDLGISKNTISRLKKNEEAQISFATAKKIADYFNVDVDCVLHGENKKSAAPESAALHIETKYDLLCDSEKKFIAEMIVARLKAQSDD